MHIIDHKCDDLLGFRFSELAVSRSSDSWGRVTDGGVNGPRPALGDQLEDGREHCFLMLLFCESARSDGSGFACQEATAEQLAKVEWTTDVVEGEEKEGCYIKKGKEPSRVQPSYIEGLRMWISRFCFQVLLYPGFQGLAGSRVSSGRFVLFSTDEETSSGRASG